MSLGALLLIVYLLVNIHTQLNDVLDILTDMNQMEPLFTDPV